MSGHELKRVLHQFHVCNYKQNIKASEMDIGRIYKICSASMCLSKFGFRLVLELDDYQLFMPTRFNTLNHVLINELANGGYTVTNTGAVGNSFNLLIAEYIMNKNEISYIDFVYPQFYNPTKDI